MTKPFTMRRSAAALALLLCLGSVACVGWRGQPPEFDVPRPRAGMHRPRATFSLVTRTTWPPPWWDKDRGETVDTVRQTPGATLSHHAAVVAEALQATGWFASVTASDAPGEMHFDFDLRVLESAVVVHPESSTLVDALMLPVSLLLWVFPQTHEYRVELTSRMRTGQGSAAASSREHTGALTSPLVLPAMPFAATTSPVDDPTRDAVRAAVREAIYRGLLPMPRPDR